MKVARNATILTLLLCSTSLFGKSAVSKFWNDDFGKNYGCGPGNFFADGDSWLSTYLASSTNATSSPLLPSSSTSKISGCNGGPPIVDHSPAYLYFVSNLHDIMRDAANGNGPSLHGLGQLWDLNPKQYQNLEAYMHQHFHEVFGDGEKHPHTIYQQLLSEITTG